MSKTLINIINRSTQQVIKDVGVTKRLEFTDEFNNPVPEGIPYHIHITGDKDYFYMTSKEHESNSILLFRVSGKVPDFVKYRKLVGRKSKEYLSENRTAPTSIDYENGFFTMYFARQANDKNAKIFEISQNDYERLTSFYVKTFLTLRISGDKDSVERDNRRNIFLENSRMFGIDLIVSPLQFYKPNKNTKESVQDRLKNYQQQTPSSTGGGSSGGSSGGGGGY